MLSLCEIYFGTRVPVVAQQLMNPTSIHEDAGSVGWGSGVAVSYGIDRRRSLDPVLLWLWYREAATALILPLAWEPTVALKR